VSLVFWIDLFSGVTPDYSGFMKKKGAFPNPGMKSFLFFNLKLFQRKMV
jgi:hypothetical protein